MVYFQYPEIFEQLLSHYDLTEPIYKAMKSKDLSDLVLVCLNILEGNSSMLEVIRDKKAEAVSISFREYGNKSYSAGKYKDALEWYNKALLQAQAGSQAMTLAYSNRSALMLKIGAHEACLKDIDTSLNLGCSPEIAEKLKKRRNNCQKLAQKEKSFKSPVHGDYFTFKGKRHPEIPCASKNVAIVRENQVPKVIAANDIKIGMVIAVEKAFITTLNPNNRFVSCYYCKSLTLNLIPCTGCSHMLFRNEECLSLCMKETLSVECQMIEVILKYHQTPSLNLAFKTVLKIKTMCNSWEKFGTATKVGTERMKESSINEIYDGNNAFSMLNFKDLRDVNFGCLYNFGFISATYLHYLSKVPGFFPTPEEEKSSAMRSFARVIMQFYLRMFNKIELINVAEDKILKDLRFCMPNHGYFAFTSKLNHQCEANLLPVSLNNRVALIALRHIKKGTELTISYVQHAYDYMHAPKVERQVRMVQLYRFARSCACPACTGSWKENPKRLTLDQERQYRSWINTNGALVRGVAGRGLGLLSAACVAMAALGDSCHTREFHAVYNAHRVLLCLMQQLSTRNVCITEGTTCSPTAGAAAVTHDVGGLDK